MSLTLLAFLLRAYRLDFQSYWIDEAWTVFYANLSIDELLHYLQTSRIVPPLYHLSTIYWIKLVGDGEYALRFYSLVFGVMAVPLTYRLGKDLGDDRLGLIAALLITVAPYQIWHSQDARNYSVLTASSTMSMWGFVNLLRRRGWRWWLIYVIGTEWTIMNHYHGVVVIGIQGLFLLLTWRRHWRRYLAWGGTLILIFLLFTPWLVLGFKSLQSFLNWIEQPTLWDSFVRSAIAYSVGELVPRPQAMVPTLVFVAVYALGLLYASRRSWGSWSGAQVMGLMVAYTIAPIIAAWLYGEIRTPVYLERYLILVQVGYLLTVAMGALAVADSLRKRHRWRALTIAAGLISLLVGIGGWVLSHHYFDPVYAKPSWRAVARTIEDFGLPGDGIVVTGDGGEKVFNLYYQREFPIYLDFNTPVPPENQARQIIANITATHHRVWYTPYGVNIDATLENWLANNAYPAWQSWLGRKRLALYGGSTTATGRLEALNITFAGSQGQELILNSVALPGEAVSAGDVLPLTLTWLATTNLDRDYQLSLRLTTGRGDIFVQSDWPPLAAAGSTSSWQPDQSITDRRGLWVPPDTPPGNYVLQLVVYDPTSGQPLGQPATISNIEVGPAEIVVPLEALSIPNPTQQALGGLTLVGYVLPESVQPGGDMWLWVYWQASPSGQLPAPESIIRLSLTSEETSISTDFPLADSVGASDSWLPGQVRRAIYHLPTHPRLAGNQAEVGVTLLSVEGEIEAETTLTQIELEQRPRQFEAPSIAQKTDISFGDPVLLILIGYQLPSTDFGPSDVLPATLYWQAEAEIELNYTVFVQLLNSDWQVVAQEDLQPQAGAAPTSTWLPGEILTDSYTVSLPSNLPPGNYRLIAGMYDPATGERLPVLTTSESPSSGDFADLGTVTIR